MIVTRKIGEEIVLRFEPGDVRQGEQTTATVRLLRIGRGRVSIGVAADRGAVRVIRGELEVLENGDCAA